MSLGNMGILTIVHAALALLVIIELGLTGHIVDRLDDGWWDTSPSSCNFMLFNSIWSILVLAYIALAPSLFSRIYLPVVALGLVAVTALFWFAGSIAMAVRIGVPICEGNGFCQTNQASVAFGFFIWAGFTTLAVFEALAFWRSKGPAAHADTRSKASTFPSV